MRRRKWEGVDARVLRVLAAASVIGVLAVVVQAAGLLMQNRAIWIPAQVVFLVCWVVVGVSVVVGLRQFVVARRADRDRRA